MLPSHTVDTVPIGSVMSTLGQWYTVDSKLTLGNILLASTHLHKQSPVTAFSHVLVRDAAEHKLTNMQGHDLFPSYKLLT